MEETRKTEKLEITEDMYNRIGRVCHEIIDLNLEHYNDDEKISKNGDVVTMSITLRSIADVLEESIGYERVEKLKRVIEIPVNEAIKESLEY